MNETSARRARPSVFYTSVKGDIDGFQIAASSDELSDDVRRSIELHSAANGKDLEGTGSAVRFYRAGDSWAVTHLVPAAADYTGREGNILAHTILLEHEDVSDPRFSVEALLAAEVFERALPSAKKAPRARLPKSKRAATYRFEELEELFSDALPEAVGWLAAGKRLAVLPTASSRLCARHCETLRLLLIGEPRDGFTFSTLNDNPVIRPYALSALLESTTPDSLATWRSRDSDLAVFDLAERSWSVPPRFSDCRGALEYGQHLVALLTAGELAAPKRVQSARELQDYAQLFAQTKRVELLSQDSVADAGELVRVRLGLLPSERPSLKTLRCLLPYVRSDRIVDELDALLPNLVAEAFEHGDIAVLVNSCLVLTHRRGSEGTQQTGRHVALQMAKGLKQAWRSAGPLLFEFEVAAGEAELPAEITERVTKVVRSQADRGGWKFSRASIESLARFGGRGTVFQRDLGFKVLQDLLAQAAHHPELLGEACEAFGPCVDSWIPDDRFPVDRLVELFARSGEDLGTSRADDLAHIVNRLVATGHTTALMVNSKRLLGAGLSPAVFVDACVLLRLPEALIRNAKRLPQSASLELARGTHALLKSREGREALAEWLHRLPYEAVPQTLADLEAARRAFEGDSRFSSHLASQLADRERVALLEALDDRVGDLRIGEVSPLVTRQLLRELRPYVGWKTLLFGSEYPGLTRVARNMVLYPRLQQAGELLAASLLTTAGILLLIGLCVPFQLEGTVGPVLREACLPLCAALLVVGAWRWRSWNGRIGDPWEDLGKRWRFRPGSALRPVALVLSVVWVLLFGDLLPAEARSFVDLPLTRIGVGWPAEWNLPLLSGGLFGLTGILGLLHCCRAEEDEETAEPVGAGTTRVGMKVTTILAIVLIALWGAIGRGWVSEAWLPERWKAAVPADQPEEAPKAPPGDK